MTTLWDTTGTKVVKALAAARRTGGGSTSGLALTLVVVADEHRVAEAEAAATVAAAAHPCRLLLVVRRDVTMPHPRLDAEVSVDGRLGPGEAVIMRMYGRLSLHAESVVLPLLAPDVPVLTWWHGEPPEKISYDPLGVFADRRVTDCAAASDPIAALHQRAVDYAPGDTDLAWTRTTPWRSLLAGAFDTVTAGATHVQLAAEANNPTAALLAGWLRHRLHTTVDLAPSSGPGVTRVAIDFDDGSQLVVDRPDGTAAVLRRKGLADRAMPLRRRDIGEQLAEELRHLDPDQPYADALASATGIAGLSDRSPRRTHVWRDPMKPEGENAENEKGDGGKSGGSKTKAAKAGSTKAAR